MPCNFILQLQHYQCLVRYIQAESLNTFPPDIAVPLVDIQVFFLFGCVVNYLNHIFKSRGDRNICIKPLELRCHHIVPIMWKKHCPGHLHSPCGNHVWITLSVIPGVKVSMIIYTSDVSIQNIILFVLYHTIFLYAKYLNFNHLIAIQWKLCTYIWSCMCCRLTDVLRDWGPQDWQLASMVCQTLWNFSGKITSTNACFGEKEAHDLSELLLEYLGKHPSCLLCGVIPKHLIISLNGLDIPVSWNVTSDMVNFSQKPFCILSEYFVWLTRFY